jgi:hypothetical protein
MASAVKHPLLEDGSPTVIGPDGASVAHAARSLPVTRRDSETCCLRLGNDLVAVDGVNRPIPIAMKNDGRDDALAEMRYIRR